MRCPTEEHNRKKKEALQPMVQYASCSLRHAEISQKKREKKIQTIAFLSWLVPKT